MFDDNQNDALSGSSLDNFDDFGSGSKKKIIKIIVISLISILILVALFFLFKSLVLNREKGGEESVIVEEIIEEEEVEDEYYYDPDYVYPDENEIPSLIVSPTVDKEIVEAVPDEAIEWLEFSNYYKAFTGNSKPQYLDYSLPLNSKIKVLNYYDINRKIDLEASLEDLNQLGFTILNNPWKKTTNNFYGFYEKLYQEEIPLFISSDFITYHYNLNLKKTFQDLESSFFFDSLWSISKQMYDIAKYRYEARLNELGNINEPVLEAQRLVLTYFAVTLELLKPQSAQIVPAGSQDISKFSVNEQQVYQFFLPEYLSKEVNEELALIRSSKGLAKSPLFLYQRNYSDFGVPAHYRNNARLNNFYLAAQWLNTLFPLIKQEDNCPDCLLDRDDWRINLIAANYIAQDIEENKDVQAEWARIYKIISFFKGLRDDLTYLHYREDYRSLFGNREIEETLVSHSNLNALKNKTLSRSFSALKGGLDFNIIDNREKAGLRLLVDFYSPLDYVFNYLSYPLVNDYLSEKAPDRNINITACPIENTWQRCNGFISDFLPLLGFSSPNEKFQENINYNNYQVAINDLRAQSLASLSTRHSAHWALSTAIQANLNTPSSVLPQFMRSQSWRDHSLFNSVSFLADWQLNKDEVLKTDHEHTSSVGSLGSIAAFSKQAYIEPNIPLLNELLSNVRMISGMLAALGSDEKSPSALNTLDELDKTLFDLRELALKQSRGEDLDKEEANYLIRLVRSYEMKSLANKTIVRTSINKSRLSQDLSDLKLLLILVPTEEGPAIMAGPSLNLIEKR